MKLENLISILDEVERELLIFQKDKLGLDSEIALLDGESGVEGVVTKENDKYYYLLEVFLAKEFIDDWVATFDTRPSDSELAKRLYEYAANDA